MAWLPLPPSLSNGQVVKYKIEYGSGKEGKWGQGEGSPRLGIISAKGWPEQLRTQAEVGEGGSEEMKQRGGVGKYAPGQEECGLGAGKGKEAKLKTEGGLGSSPTTSPAKVGNAVKSLPQFPHP